MSILQTDKEHCLPCFLPDALLFWLLLAYLDRSCSSWVRLPEQSARLTCPLSFCLMYILITMPWLKITQRCWAPRNNHSHAFSFFKTQYRACYGRPNSILLWWIVLLICPLSVMLLTNISLRADRDIWTAALIVSIVTSNMNYNVIIHLSVWPIYQKKMNVLCAFYGIIVCLSCRQSEKHGAVSPRLSYRIDLPR